MRYAQGGGLTDAERTTRERLRLQAVERFAGGRKNAEIAAALRISLRSVERWRRAWHESSETGVLPKERPPVGVELGYRRRGLRGRCPTGGCSRIAGSGYGR
ncbi:helix-turn-helix domain-containing protein [Streptomyces anulatus]